MDCSLPGSSVHGVLQTKISEWVAISSSRRSSRPRDWTRVSCVTCIADRFFTCWAIRGSQANQHPQPSFLLLWHTDSSTHQSPGESVSTLTAWPHPTQHFWFSRSGLALETMHPWQAPKLMLMFRKTNGVELSLPRSRCYLRKLWDRPTALGMTLV